jgi:hypothetical protein
MVSTERDVGTDRPFDRALSASGAVGLLAIALLGPAGVAVAIVAFAILTVVVVGAPPWTVRRRPIPTIRVADEDRWLAWRKVDPDPEFSRVGRRRRRAA